MNDEALTRAAATAFADIDPLPGGVLDAARDALRHRLPGAVLAEPGDPSVLPCGVRGGDGQRVAFSGGGASVELSVRGAELTGRVRPVPASPVTLRRATGPSARQAADDAGRFAFCDLPPGPASIVFAGPDGATVATSWFRV
ncbi:carboxypeptidase-like regulatory domain-containing protein [Actinomadura flavalba]|uniref:carboxypeptidase-like regulatory domain-containing protein n=1 Tax=Actinomadura flavalba TaxID=1120938 RepID=UPI0003732BDB|nr:carboxypeptidase-like regulatory domain-containing protein [Actinomadura flavalba]